MNETIGYTLIAVGLAFDLFGCIGLVRLPDVFNRLPAAAKCATLGTSSILGGIIVLNGLFTAISLKAILCIIFIGLTAPTGAHALSRAAHIYGVKMSDKTVVDKYREEVLEGKNSEKA